MFKDGIQGFLDLHQNRKRIVGDLPSHLRLDVFPPG